ncbi:hypothetical protein ACE6H2_007001 [Prunus campanulata]
MVCKEEFCRSFSLTEHIDTRSGWKTVAFPAIAAHLACEAFTRFKSQRQRLPSF